MIANELGLYPGGLMRCCTGTLDECRENVEVGHVLQCKYSTNPMHRMVLRKRSGDDAPHWEWLRTEETK